MNYRGSVNGEGHTYSLRVFYEDTDAAGIVYYANYLKYLERARTEMLRAVGITHSNLFAEYTIVFVVRRCVLDYRKPARLDDLLIVHTHIVSMRGASIDLTQNVICGEDILVEAELRLACVTNDEVPARIPKKLRDTITILQAKK